MKTGNLFKSAVSIDMIKNCTDFNEALQMVLDKKGWTLTNLANDMGYSLKHVSCVIHHKNEMTLGFARRLEGSTELPALFWIELYLDKYEV